MVIINTVSDTKFSYNGIEYFKNFTPVVVGATGKIRVLNTYDSSIELTETPTLYSQFELNGVVYASVILLQVALLPVLFTRDSLGGGGGGTTFDPATHDLDEFQNLNPDPYVRVSGLSGSTPLATTTVSGTVKTDVLEANPIVYTKASVDALLALIQPETLAQAKGFIVDFVAAPANAYPFTGVAAASGTTALPTVRYELGHAGQIDLKSSASLNSGYGYEVISNTSAYNNGQNLTGYASFKLKSVTDTVVYFGLDENNPFSYAEPTSGVYLKIVNDQAVFISRDITLTTASAATTLIVDTWYNCMIEFLSATEVVLTIKKDDGTLIKTATSTTNLPAITVPIGVNLRAYSTIATTARTIATLDSLGQWLEKPNYLNAF